MKSNTYAPFSGREAPTPFTGPKKRAGGPISRLAGAFLAGLILAGCGGGGGGGGSVALPGYIGQPPKVEPAPEQPIKPPPVCSVQLEGDSVLHGAFTGGSLAEVPAAALKRLRPAYRVVDRTQSGNYVNLRLPTFLAEPADTRFVVLQFGLNDGGQGMDYREPLRSMVQRVKAQKLTPMITGLSRVRGAPPWRDAYDELARQVASEEGAIFADWGAAAYADGDMADDLHPAQAYSTRLVEQLVKALDAAAPECAQ